MAKFGDQLMKTRAAGRDAPAAPAEPGGKPISATVYVPRALWHRVRAATMGVNASALSLVLAYLERFDRLDEDDPERAEMLERARQVHVGRVTR